jgi:hypothetical protein
VLSRPDDTDVPQTPASPLVDAGAARPYDREHRGELWDAWLFAEAEAGLALSAWCAAGRAHKAPAYAFYAAALAREAQAASVLAIHRGAGLS